MATRRDSKHRVLRSGESIRQDGRYQFKYHVNGKAHFVYSWRLEPTDKLPVGKKPCLSLRELEKQIGYDLDNRLDPVGKNITVNWACGQIACNQNRSEIQHSDELQFCEKYPEDAPIWWYQDFKGKDFRCKAISDKTAVGRRQGVQFCKDNQGCFKTCIPDGGGWRCPE